jgi:hypothetical protein
LCTEVVAVHFENNIKTVNYVGKIEFWNVKADGATYRQLINVFKRLLIQESFS